MKTHHRWHRPRTRTRLAVHFGLLVAVVAMAAPNVAPLSAQEVALAWQFHPGQVDTYVMTQSSRSETPMGVTTGSQTTTLRLEVLRVAPDGTAEIRYTYEAIRSEQDGPAGRQEYDSRVDAEPADPGMRMLAGMVGADILVTMQPDGTVESVSGIESLIDDMVDAAAGDAPEQADEMRAMFETMFGEEQMESVMQQNVHMLPAEPVSPGHEWSEDLSLVLPFGTLRAAYSYRLVDVGSRGGRRLARIAMTADSQELEVSEESPLAMLGFTLSSSDISGELEFDVDAGRLHQLSTTSEMAIEAMGMSMIVESTLGMERLER